MAKRDSTTKPQVQRNALGARIRRAREGKGWSQNDLARKLQLDGWDVERTVITKIELHRRCITDYELLAIADVLGVSLDSLARPKPRLRHLLGSE